jgi:hypothetical protein
MIKQGSWLLFVAVLLCWGCAKRTLPIQDKEDMADFTPVAAQYGYLQGKAKIVLEEESGKVTRGTLHVRALKDSLLWFSLSPGLGVEAIRGLVSEDKIQLRDRVGSQDLNLSYAEFERRYGISLSLALFQNMIWANLPHSATFEDRLIRVGKKFELTQVRNKVRYFSKTDTRHGKVAELSVSSLEDKGAILASFPKFQDLNAQPFPAEALYKVAIQDSDGQHHFRIYLNWSTLDPQASPLTFPFRF